MRNAKPHPGASNDVKVVRPILISRPRGPVQVKCWLILKIVSGWKAEGSGGVDLQLLFEFVASLGSSIP